MQRFQARHGLAADGSVGPATLAALNVPVEQRIDQLRANLERGRWVMGDLERDFIVVNIAGFRTYVVHDDEVVWSTRSQVGKPYRATPIFKAKMTYVVLNPTWTVPPTIFRQDILPQLRRDSGYLATRNIDLVDAARGVVDPTTVDWIERAQLSLQLRAAPGAHERARAHQVHVPERALRVFARHAEPRPVRADEPRVQLGLHPDRESARARDAAARLEVEPRANRPAARERPHARPCFSRNRSR